MIIPMSIGALRSTTRISLEADRGKVKRRPSAARTKPRCDVKERHQALELGRIQRKAAMLNRYTNTRPMIRSIWTSADVAKERQPLLPEQRAAVQCQQPLFRKELECVRAAPQGAPGRL